jgi:tetratricopeptide (TPR) repeat protein
MAANPYRFCGYYAEAESLLKSALASATQRKDIANVAEAKRVLALVYERVGRYDEEITLYQQLLDDKPEMANTWKLWTAAIQRYMGEYDESIESLKLLLKDWNWSEKSPIGMRAVLDISECLFLQGKPAEGEAYLDEALKDHPDLKYWAMLQKGVLLSRYSKDTNRAIEVLQEFMFTYPPSAGTDEVRDSLISALQTVGRIDDAVQQVRSAATGELTCEQTVAQSLRIGAIYYQGKRYVSAIENFNKVRSSDCSSYIQKAEATYYAGLNYEAVKHWVPARACMVEVAKQYADSLWAKDARGWLYSHGAH